eukprot:Skav201577  [mRNA]  locus=scaffold152:125523:128658:- [translate_table: standard]
MGLVSGMVLQLLPLVGFREIQVHITELLAIPDRETSIGAVFSPKNHHPIEPVNPHSTVVASRFGHCAVGCAVGA